MRLRIQTDGAVVASAPKRISDEELSRFVDAHRAWIEKKRVAMMQKRTRIKQLGTGSDAEYHSLKEKAHAVAMEHIARINSVYNFVPKKITIRNQKTRWGSCSSRGGITFNYRIALLPYELAEYLVAHELCHLGEMNHSQRFWKLVEQTIPDWKQRRVQLHQYGLSEQ
jgi:predicted metal-dependent hydrolase